MNGEDEAAARVELPSFDEFRSESEVLERIENIKSFQYSVLYQNSGVISGAHVLQAIRVQCIAALSDMLERTGLHRLHQIDAELVKKNRDDDPSNKDEALLNLTLQDDVYGFRIAVLENRLVLARNDSPLATFYEWYGAVMPSMHIIESTLRRAVATSSGTELRVVGTTYEFTFNFAEFTSIPAAAARGAASTPQRRRNLDALKKLIQNLPDQSGEMRDISKQDFVRLDLTLSRVERFEHRGREKYRNAWYFLEAPANEHGNYLVYRVQLRNTSIEIPNQDDDQPARVVPFDTDNAEDFQIALLDFLKDRAIEGFASKFLEALNFVSTRYL